MIDIEKIDLVMERTNAEYKIVREALITCDGDVEKAINYIETRKREESVHEEGKEEPKEEKKTASKQAGAFAQDIIDTIKEIWEKGNASSLVVEKNGEVLLRLSLTVSTIGLVIAPVAAVIGLGAALITEYTIKIYLDNGEVVNVNEVAIHRKHTQKIKIDESSSEESDQ